MPYAPQTQYRGDAYMFEGISRAGQSTADGIERRKRDRGMFDALAKYAVEAGYADKDTVVPMSLPQLTGFVRGKEMQAMQSERSKKEARAEKLTSAQMDNMAADNARKEAAAQAAAKKLQTNKALIKGVADLSEMQGPNPDGTTVGDVGLEGILRTARDVGFDGDPAELDAFAEMLQRGRVYEPRLVTKKDEKGRAVTFGVTGPNQSQIVEGDEMTPAQKRQYAASLQASRRQFLLGLANPVIGASENSGLLKAELANIEAELAELGFGGARQGASPPPEASAAPGAPSPAVAPAPAKRGVYNPKTGKVEEVP